jgi:hypothetical protein
VDQRQTKVSRLKAPVICIVMKLHYAHIRLPAVEEFERLSVPFLVTGDLDGRRCP